MRYILASLDSVVSSADRIQKAALHMLLCGDLNLDLILDHLCQGDPSP